MPNTPKDKPSTASFSLGEVLTATSEVAFLDPQDYEDDDTVPVSRRISRVLTFLTQAPQPLEIHQLPRAADAVGRVVMQQSPLLAEILASQPDPETGSNEDFRQWYEEVKRNFDLDQSIELQPIENLDYSYMTAEEEARMLGALYIDPNNN